MTRVTYERDGEGIGHITLRRERVHNAIDQPLLDELGEALARYDADDDAAVAILTGAGPSFCAGADVKAFRAPGVGDGARRRPGLKGLTELLLVRDRYKPLVAAAHGHVIGAGLRLLLLSDFALCADDAQLCVTELRYGLDAGPYRALLQARAGDAFAMDVAGTGRTWAGREAAARGVVIRSVPEDALAGEAQELARCLQQQPRGALSALVEGRRSTLRSIELSAWMTRGRGLGWSPEPVA